jgi:phospholipid-binding lipoprotein MlaA
LFAGCATDFDQSLPEGEASRDKELILKGVDDPIEPFNRTLFAFNKGLVEYALYPASQGYNYVMPESARSGLSHFYDNILFPVRVVNNLLQGQWSGAWVETKRFGINTTVGYLGFTDPATEDYKLTTAEEDLGLTFQHYGWEPQMYLFLPFWGGSSERDFIGKVGDYFLDPTSYYLPASLGLKFNDISFEAKNIYDVLTTEYDAYELAHLLYSIQRRTPKYAMSFKSEMESGKVQTIYAVFAKPQDGAFYKKMEEQEIEVEGFRDSLKYNVWKQEAPAKTVFVLGGLGEHRSSSRLQSLAELAYNQGYNVVSFSSTFNWEFLSSGPKDFLPGYIHDDLAQIDAVFAAIDKDLVEEYGADQFKEKSVMGMSLGAWYTLNLSARNDQRFEKYIAINPPVNLIQALNSIDSMYRAPFENNSTEKAVEVANVAALKALASMTGSPQVSNELPFTEQEASFLIGLNFRMTLKNAIFAGQFDEMTSYYNSRQDVYAKLSEISFKDYYTKMVTPAVEARGVKNLKESADIRNLEAELMKGENLRVFLTSNDFLLNKEQLEWFKTSLKDKVSVSDFGGHLGNLVSPEVMKQISEALAQ